MHTKKKGKSSSRKLRMEEAEAKSGLGKEEIEKLIVSYAKSGMPAELIGETLKKKHNVLYIRKETGKRLMQIIKENNLESSLPPDMLQLVKKAVNIREHLSSNKSDVHNRIRLGRIESKIWRLVRYYKKEGVLSRDWKYDPSTAELIIRGKA
jgi:small subunit ribosomal protein S15